MKRKTLREKNFLETEKERKSIKIFKRGEKWKYFRKNDWYKEQFWNCKKKKNKCKMLHVSLLRKQCVGSTKFRWNTCGVCKSWNQVRGLEKYSVKNMVKQFAIFMRDSTSLFLSRSTSTCSYRLILIKLFYLYLMICTQIIIYLIISYFLSLWGNVNKIYALYLKPKKLAYSRVHRWKKKHN